MEIHRYESVWIVVSVIMIVAWIATVTYGAIGPGIAMIDDEGGTVEADSIANGEFDSVENFESPGVYESDEQNTYDVYVVARQFAFAPGTTEPIEVPAGSTVKLHVTSADVVHGLELAGTNVNTMVIPGQIATFTVEFDETGDYGIVCNEYCGSQHHEMAGTFSVVSQSEFEGGN